MNPLRHFLRFALMALLLAGCSETAPTGPELAEEPWTRQFTFGNSFINTGEIVTNQDGISADYLADYVTEAALPNVDLELFTTHVYLPAADGMTTRITGGSIVARRTDGSRTPDFFQSAQYVQRSSLGGESYDVHRLDGLYLGTPALRPGTFANVVFRFDFDYVDGERVVYTGTRTVEIYRR